MSSFEQKVEVPDRNWQYLLVRIFGLASGVRPLSGHSPTLTLLSRSSDCGRAVSDDLIQDSVEGGRQYAFSSLTSVHATFELTSLRPRDCRYRGHQLGALGSGHEDSVPPIPIRTAQVRRKLIAGRLSSRRQALQPCSINPCIVLFHDNGLTLAEMERQSRLLIGQKRLVMPSAHAAPPSSLSTRVRPAHMETRLMRHLDLEVSERSRSRLTKQQPSRRLLPTISI